MIYSISQFDMTLYTYAYLSYVDSFWNDATFDTADVAPDGVTCLTAALTPWVTPFVAITHVRFAVSHITRFRPVTITTCC